VRSLVSLAAAIALGAACALGCHGRPRSFSPSKSGPAESSGTPAVRISGTSEIVEIDLTRGAAEAASATLMGGPKQTYFQLVTLLHTLAEDTESRGVLVRFGTGQIGWARAQETGLMLLRLRDAGKHVVCHADGYVNTTAWIAARGCSRVWVSPAGQVDTVGVAAQVLYAHELLADKLGIDVDFLQVGKFKGAEEPFTRDSPSSEARESIESTLSAIRQEWLAGLSSGRGEALRKAAEDGPFAPEQARSLGLVDAIGYLDEARDDAKRLSGADRFDVRFGLAAHAQEKPDLAELLRILAGGGPSHGGPPHVAVVRAVGAIAMDGGGSILGQRAGITERSLGRIIRVLSDDKSTKAVVLRIDSPGGSALASDLLWHQLMQLRKKKPLVVSIGDMAASGGYYLASAASRIVAEPTSIVGSIGVVGGKLGFGRSLERIGVHVETFAARGAPSASRAAYDSPLVAWDPATRARVKEEMQAIYDLFLRRVAEGRGVSVEVVSEAAEGRIFAGQAAKNAGLVDEWGGLSTAIARAISLGNLDADAPVRLVGETTGIWDLLDSDNDASGDDGDIGSLTGGATLALARSTGAVDGKRLQALLASILPLARGERTLTALPFALLLD
jgi:protease IV